jgi:alpha-N-arabinofuranosidase
MRGIEMQMSSRLAPVVAIAPLCLLIGLTGCGFVQLTASDPPLTGIIEVDASQITGEVPRYLFGQFMEHEHNTIDNGLLAQLLQDRKFDEGDLDGDGVAYEWAPEERVQDRYWQLRAGRALNGQYYIDHSVYYGGGASQAIRLYGSGSSHASIYQIGLQFAKGRRYSFYVYLRQQGTGKAFVDVDKQGGPVYFHKDFAHLSPHWKKYTAEFTVAEDTSEGRLRIGFQGAGTFWMDSASLMPADNIDGMRRDVIEALRPMRISVLRYPGGCYADYYHWQDGIGPRDKRPERWSTVWHEWNSNDFGTDEYADLARLLGFSGHITANYISGTAPEAAQWVEYANGPLNSPMGRLRARNGHAEPYGIKFWAVGNEAPTLCSEEYTGGTKLRDYARRFRDYEDTMKKVDPSIRVMASSVGRPEWVRQMFQTMPVDLLATSIYTGSYGKTKQICDPNDFYQKVVAEPLEFKRKLDANIDAAGSLLPSRPFFAITEFNSWWLPETQDPDYRLANGLYFASVFNTLLRQSQHVFLAEACSLINVQGMIEVNPVAVKLTPPYFAYVLYTNHIGGEVVKTLTTSPLVVFNPQLAALDAVATLSADRHTLDLAVVNRSQSNAVSAEVHLSSWVLGSGEVQAYELNGKSWDASNPYASTENVNIRQRSIKISRATFQYNFPAHSATVLEVHGNPGATP